MRLTGFGVSANGSVRSEMKAGLSFSCCISTHRTPQQRREGPYGESHHAYRTAGLVEHR